MKSNKRRVLFKQAPAADANAQEPQAEESNSVMTLLDDLSLSDSSDGNEDRDRTCFLMMIEIENEMGSNLRKKLS